MADDGLNPVFQGFLDRGLSPVHAAALAGNMQQESGFNPNALNQNEGAHGLMQWRLDRWQALQDYAKARGADPNDRNTQLDFVMHELQGPEARAGSRFLAAADLPSANAALKGYIRYGDDTQGQRLDYASRILGRGGNQAAGIPVSLPSSMASSSQAAPFGLASAAPAAPATISTAAPQAAPAAPAPMQVPISPMAAAASPAASGTQVLDTTPLNLQLTSLAKNRLLAAMRGIG